TPAQRERFLPVFLADTRFHLAHASAEPDGEKTLGIHYHRAEGAEASLRTTAERSGDSWLLNGSKHHVVNVPLAKIFAVEAATAGCKGTSTILVPRDAPGLTVLDDAGMQHGACGRIELRDCRVPAENLVGAEGERQLAGEIERRLPQDLALNLGIGRAAYEAARDYAQLRVQGGRRIIQHHAIGAKL